MQMRWLLRLAALWMPVALALAGSPVPAQVSIPDDLPSSPRVAQRAVLYEEDPSEPQGRRFVGSVIWRTDRASLAPGQPPELAVYATIEVPERKLAMTWLLRANSDRDLPASHIIEVTFDLPPDLSSDRIANLPGILMKESEQSRGSPLSGLSVKVTEGFFMIGLSDVPADKSRNLKMLQERGWLDIPIVYGNGRRAILAVEKGAAGTDVFRAALAAWGQPEPSLSQEPLR
jgi:hypothetical protein